MPRKPIIDPLGRSITLHEHTWFAHILKGHPDMASKRAEAENAIRNPEKICHSTSDPDCRLYFGPLSHAGIMVVVVADVVKGVVKTAYRTKKLKGAVEWSR